MKQVLLAPSQIIKPVDHGKRLPLLGSLKLDGNRLLVHDGVCYTRSMKVQPNRNLNAFLKEAREWTKATGGTLDGELYNHGVLFSDLQEAARSFDAPIPAGVQFHVFDYLSPGNWDRPDLTRPFEHRVETLAKLWESNQWPNVKVVKHKRFTDTEEIERSYAYALSEGYEGLILRDPNGQYRHGRATVKQGIIFKLKPFDNLDAKVIGFEQQRQVRDDIERKTNEMGRTARTHKAEDHVLVDSMGSLQVRDEKGREFNVGWGRGWTHAKREELWRRRADLVGQWVEVRYMAIGEKDLPRMPQLIRFRESKE